MSLFNKNGNGFFDIQTVPTGEGGDLTEIIELIDSEETARIAADNDIIDSVTSIQEDVSNKSSVGHTHTLNQLTDVNLGTPLNNNVLTYDSTTLKWVPKSVPTGEGGGGSSDFPVELGVKITTEFGVIGNGSTDDTTAINTAMSSANPVIIFPKGVYKVTGNITFPKSKSIVFTDGAIIKSVSPSVITFDSEIIAPPTPIFIGDGTYQTTVKGKIICPQWFGAGGIGDEERALAPATGSITSGTNTLTLSGDYSKFRDGQTIMVIHAGIDFTEPFPNPCPAPASAVIEGSPLPDIDAVTTGSSTYKYKMAILDKYGAITQVSSPITVSDAPSHEYFNYYMGCRIKITPPEGVTYRHGYAIYGDQTNPVGHRGILGIIRDVGEYWDDIGEGNISQSIPPWIPPLEPSVKLHNTLITTIVSGGGTNTLTLADNAGATVSDAQIMLDDTPAINRSYEFLETGGGGTLELPSGVYHIRTNPQTSDGIYFTNDVRTVSTSKQSVILAHLNVCNDMIRVLRPKISLEESKNWSFEGVTFDGGNRVYTTEYAFFMICSNPLPQTASNFLIKDCEFRYSRGKYIFTGVHGEASDYRITGNWFHHGNSNAVGNGGNRWSVDNNTFSDIIIHYGGTGDLASGAEGIIVGSDETKLNTYGSIVDNTFNRYGNIAFHGDDNEYKHIVIARNRINQENIGIGVGGICEGINIIDNEINLFNNSPLNGHGIKVTCSHSASSYINCSISNNTINVDGECTGISFTSNSDRTSFFRGISISGNRISLKNSTQFPMEIQHLTEVILSNNVIETDADNAVVDLAISTVSSNSLNYNWTVTGNIASGKNIQLPNECVVTGNLSGGLRLGKNSTAVGNTVNGVTGSNSWGGLIAIGGSGSIIANNIIDFTGASTASGIVEISSPCTNTIVGNSFINMTTQEKYHLISHQGQSIIANNQGYNMKSIEEDKIPTTFSYWNKGDKVIHTDPTTSVGWVCTGAGYTVANGAWTTAQSYNEDHTVSNAGKVYKATNSGTSGDTAPTHTSGTVSDGTVSWIYIGLYPTFKTYGNINS
jgi:hypothetical protein